MAKLVTDDLASLANQTTAINTLNENFAAVEGAMENTLSLDGTSPNALETNLDLNGNKILNIGAPTAPTDLVRLQDLQLSAVTGIVVPTPALADNYKLLQINGAGDAYALTGVEADASGNLLPPSNNTAQLGSGSLSWADLFIGSGGVLNFNNNNYTITHGADLLTFNKAITITAGPLTVTTGNIVVASGNVNLTSGNATLTAGNLTLTNGTFTITAGNAVLTSGNLTLTSGNATLTDGDLTLSSGFVDVLEIAAPANPSANFARVYSADVSATTGLFMRDSAGVATRLDTRAASTAEMEAASATDVFASPANLLRHPCIPKVVLRVLGGATPSIASDFGVASISRPGAGRLIVTFDTAFSSVNYTALVTVERSTTALTVADTIQANIRFGGITVGTCEFECYDSTATTNVAEDPATWHIVIYGDQ